MGIADREHVLANRRVIVLVACDRRERCALRQLRLQQREVGRAMRIEHFGFQRLAFERADARRAALHDVRVAHDEPALRHDDAAAETLHAHDAAWIVGLGDRECALAGPHGHDRSRRILNCLRERMRDACVLRRATQLLRECLRHNRRRCDDAEARLLEVLERRLRNVALHMLARVEAEQRTVRVEHRRAVAALVVARVAQEDRFARELRAADLDAARSSARDASEGEHLLAFWPRQNERGRTRLCWRSQELRGLQRRSGLHTQQHESRRSVGRFDGRQEPRVLRIVELHVDALVLCAVRFAHEVAPRQHEAIGMDDDAARRAHDRERAARTVDFDDDVHGRRARLGDEARRARASRRRSSLVGRRAQQGRAGRGLRAQRRERGEDSDGENLANGRHPRRLAEPAPRRQRHLPLLSFPSLPAFGSAPAAACAFASLRFCASSIMRFWILR